MVVRFRASWTLTPILLSLLALTGCDSEKEADKEKPKPAAETQPSETPRTSSETTSSKSADEPAKADEKVAEAKFDGKKIIFGKSTKLSMYLPSGWKQEEPANRMRIFQATLPKHENDSTNSTLTVYQMQGGDLESNRKRWSGQFGGEESFKGKKTFKTGSGAEVTYLEYAGTYTPPSFMKAGGPQEDQVMLIAIVPGSQDTDKNTFIKVLGPRHTVEANKAQFLAMVKSFK